MGLFRRRSGSDAYDDLDAADDAPAAEEAAGDLHDAFDDDHEDEEPGGPVAGAVSKVLAALVVAGLFAAVILYAYSWSVDQQGQEQLPVVQAEPGPEKVKPTDPGGMDVPYQDQLVLNEGAERGEGEQLLPPPEKPETGESGKTAAEDQSTAGERGADAPDGTSASDVSAGNAGAAGDGGSAGQGDDGSADDGGAAEKASDAANGQQVASAEGTRTPEGAREPDAGGEEPATPSQSATGTQSDGGAERPDDVEPNPEASPESASTSESSPEADPGGAEAGSEPGAAGESGGDPNGTDAEREVAARTQDPEADGETADDTAGGGTFLVQLAAFQNRGNAERAWQRIQNKHQNVLGNQKLQLQRKRIPDKGIFWRVRTGPFPNRATANDVCGQLKDRGQPCLVMER